MLLDLGLRCVSLDCMGYGETGFSPDLSAYTFKHHADAVAALAAQLGLSKIMLGGHDWGGAVVYRVAQFYPELVTHVFSVATPYFPVLREYRSADDLVKGGLRVFAYQLQLGSAEHVVEKCLGKDERKARRFLNGIYGGKPRSGKSFMTGEEGVDLGMVEGREEIRKTPLLDDEVGVLPDPLMHLLTLTECRRWTSMSPASSRAASKVPAIGTALAASTGSRTKTSRLLRATTCRSQCFSSIV